MYSMKNGMIDHANDRVNRKIPFAQPLSDDVLNMIDTEYAWLLRPYTDESPKVITWDLRQANYLAMPKAQLCFWAENGGVTQPEFKDTEHYVKVDTQTGEAWNAFSMYAEAIVGKLTELRREGELRYNKQLKDWEPDDYKIGASLEKRWKEDVEPNMFPTLASIYQTLDKGEEVDVTVTINKDRRLTDSHERDAEGNHVNARAARQRLNALADAPEATEEVHHFKIFVDRFSAVQKVRQSVETAYQYAKSDGWFNENRKAEPVSKQKPMTISKRKSAAGQTDVCPEGTKKSPNHKWITKLEVGMNVDDGNNLHVCKKCNATRDERVDS